MFPFWDLAIAPVLAAIHARSVVEIGSWRGRTTTKLLDTLGPEAELHVIDPLPEFDPAEHERSFPGRYVFHRDLSLRVLPTLPSVDAALIDGDHNWYTVYNELKLLAATARDAGKPLPVMLMHDVCWPYGRRDLYYDPSQIPSELRQPYARRGIKRGHKALAPVGGLNPTLHNAVREGGPRNGVATGLDDFLGEHDRPTRRVVLPIYFGLAIVADEERLACEPALVELLDWLEGGECQREMLTVADRLWTGSMVSHHSALFAHGEESDRAARRYLELLKGALLDDHYLENEVRNHYLMVCAQKGIDPDPQQLRDPASFRPAEMLRLQASRKVGRLAQDGNDKHPYFPYTTMGRTRLDHLSRCLDAVRREGVPGDLVECGTGRGGAGIYMRGYIDALNVEDRCVWVADTFRPPPNPPPRKFQPIAADLNAVRQGFARFGLLDGRVRFLQGAFDHTLHDAPIHTVALLRIGDSLEGPPAKVLERLYDKLAPGGFVLVEDYAAPARQASVDGFRSGRGIADPIERIDAAGAFWRKTAHAAPAVAAPAVEPFARAPMARPAPSSDRKDLTVVVVFYDMRREAERTLHSLSRAYQEGVEDLDYEVIAVENGSASDQELGESFVRGFGPEFRYLGSGPEATRSPASAVNRGVAAARGEELALMIDGAHVLSPGVLRFGIEGLRSHSPAVVATQQWYVGPGQQHEVVNAGYDAESEDRLFKNIGWPSRGYDLFKIGHFVGERDWFSPIAESNCLFVARSLLEQVGGFDESFSMAGGGYANLELFERLGASPGVTVVTILGEGSFHQVHGGTTTNTGDAVERRRRIAAYREHYAATRGKDFRRPAKDVHYVGHMPRDADRTKARRRVAPLLFKSGWAADLDGYPQEPTPIPDELKLEFVDAFWRGLGWEQTPWLGRRLRKSAADLIAYQELVVRLAPDWIVETHAGDSALAPFLASICDLLGRGRVLSIGSQTPRDELDHSRVRRMTGPPAGEATVEAVRATLGESPNALVVLGSRTTLARTMEEFTAYAPFVPCEGYLVIEDTIVGGHPVWPSFGVGPADAVRTILRTGLEFTSDRTLERYGPTFNPGGYLRRVSR